MDKTENRTSGRKEKEKNKRKKAMVAVSVFIIIGYSLEYFMNDKKKLVEGRGLFRQ